MRSIVIIHLVLMSASGIAAMDRSAADSLVQLASERYAQEDISGALAIYDEVAASWNSAALQYNLGNCHYKMGDVPRAILHYERASRLAPGDPDILANLELARQQVVDRVHELPGISLGATWSRIRGGRDPDQWARRSIVICALFFMILAIAMWVRQRTTAILLKGVAVLLAACTVVAVLFAMVRSAEVRDDSEAIVMPSKVEVRSEPDPNATVLFVLHKGTKLTIEHDADEWHSVRLANGEVGWMPRTALERI